jgi:EAL domain-containing protein (putative c-di-GMP-specific phosphodiesterase class I)/CheY-like chemotaxis protein
MSTTGCPSSSRRSLRRVANYDNACRHFPLSITRTFRLVWGIVSRILAAPKSKETRILLIENELPLLELFGSYLRDQLNCEVHCAADREEAEALLDCYKYSLVIADLSLTPQRLEGLDLIEELADAHERPRIVALCGTGTDGMKSLALSAGADVFMEKPWLLSDLASILRQLTSATSFASPKPPTGRLLRQLLRKGGIVPLVQPIFELDGNARKLAGVECLSRGPRGTPFHRADAIFSYARHKKVEHIVDQHCISVALEAASALPEPIRLSLNVHASTLGRCSDFCGWLCSTAAKNSIDTQRLTIEIVEHVPVWDKSEFFQTLAALREAGMRIAMDDVGLGHSNFQMMVDVKPDYFKLDRYFVHGCHRDKSHKAVVASVAKLAEELGSSVVAEGIEDPADLKILQDLGITLVQGFMFCRPISFDQFRKSQEADDFCACSLESPTGPSQCQLKGLGLCSRTDGQAAAACNGSI